MTLQLSAGAILKAIPNGEETYEIVGIRGVTDVNVIGGTLLGERAQHTGTSGEWGMGLLIDSSANVVVEGVTAREGWGDGFYVGGTSQNVTFCSLLADHNRRQGVSLCGVDGMVIRDSVFQNTAGTPPEAGIDIEPDPPQAVRNVVISRCTFTNNAGPGVAVGVPFVATGQAWVEHIEISDSTVTNSQLDGFILSNCSDVTVSNNLVQGNAQVGIDLQEALSGSLVTGNQVLGNTQDGIVAYMGSGNTVTGNTVSDNGGRGIYVIDDSGTTVTDNQVTGNAGCGIEVSNTTGATVTGNTEAGNGPC